MIFAMKCFETKWLINVLRAVFAIDCYEKFTSHWMGFCRSFDQSKRLTFMVLKWRQRLARQGSSTWFLVDFKDPTRKTGEVYGRLFQRMRRIHEHRTMTRGKSSVSVRTSVSSRKRSSCAAVEKTCSNCGEQGHFAGVCKGAPKGVTDSPNIAQQRNAKGLRYATMEYDTGSDDECLFAIGGNMETTLSK